MTGTTTLKIDKLPVRLSGSMTGAEEHDRVKHQEDELQEDELQADTRDYLNPHRMVGG